MTAAPDNCIIPFLSVHLNTTEISPDEDYEDSSVIGWHPSGSCLTIFNGTGLEIRLGIDSEICEIRPQDPDTVNYDTALVFLRMWPSRPLPWAAKTDFDPLGGNQKNRIAIKLDLSKPDPPTKYQKLVDWLYQNSDEVELISAEEARQSLEALNKKYHTHYGVIPHRSLQCLDEGHWADDEIINWGLRYFHENCALGRDVLLMDTYFFPRLTGTEGQRERAIDTDASESIFEMHLAVIPIHQNDHWFLVLIVLPGLALEDDSCDRLCRILVLNSKKFSAKEAEKLKKVMIDWLIDTAAKIYEKDRVNVDNISFTVVKVPQQENNDDCGYYLLHFAGKAIEDGLLLTDRCRKNGKNTSLNDVWGDPKSMRANMKAIIEAEI